MDDKEVGTVSASVLELPQAALLVDEGERQGADLERGRGGGTQGIFFRAPSQYVPALFSKQ